MQQTSTGRHLWIICKKKERDSIIAMSLYVFSSRGWKGEFKNVALLHVPVSLCLSGLADRLSGQWPPLNKGPSPPLLSDLLSLCHEFVSRRRIGPTMFLSFANGLNASSVSPQGPPALKKNGRFLIYYSFTDGCKSCQTFPSANMFNKHVRISHGNAIRRVLPLRSL